jgi:hypothetical protein
VLFSRIAVFPSFRELPLKAKTFIIVPPHIFFVFKILSLGHAREKCPSRISFWQMEYWTIEKHLTGDIPM